MNCLRFDECQIHLKELSQRRFNLLFFKQGTFTLQLIESRSNDEAK